MTPTFSNSSPSPFSAHELINEDHQLIYSPNLQASSSSCLSCHDFFGSNDQDQSGIRHGQIIQYQREDETLASHGGSYDVENENNNGLKFSIWKKPDTNEDQSEYTSIKWMSSKMRLMRKMKNPDGTAINYEVPKIIKSELEDHDHKQPSLSPMDADNSSNSSSHNSNNIPVRVCADCNTTKTPLWRGGPRGPKSLCNACGIRQRKARRAMAAAAAAENGTILETKSTPTKKMKLQKKDKRSNNGHVAKFKKRSKLLMTSSPSQSKKKLCFEDLLINLSKNLAFHRVFPQDEKEAAILLMALSCGLVHG